MTQHKEQARQAFENLKIYLQSTGILGLKDIKAFRHKLRHLPLTLSSEAMIEGDYLTTIEYENISVFLNWLKNEDKPELESYCFFWPEGSDDPEEFTFQEEA